MKVLNQAQSGTGNDKGNFAELEALVLAYRRTALKYHHHWMLLFGLPLPEFEPTKNNRSLLPHTDERLQAIIDCLVGEADAML